MNPLLALKQLGQFVWLDHISRSLITGGGLRRLIEEDGLGGVTSNPTIFDKAIAGSTDYDAGFEASKRFAITDAFGSRSARMGRKRKTYWRLLQPLALTCTRSPNSYRQTLSRHSPLRSISWSPL